MHGISDSALLKKEARKEARVYRDAGQLFSELAQHLHSAGADLTSKANDIQRQSECARLSEDKIKWARRRASNLAVREAARENREGIEERTTAMAIKAAKVLEQAHIIKTRVQSLTEATVEGSENSSDTIIPRNGVLSQLHLADVPSFICALAAEILIKAELVETVQYAEAEECEESDNISSKVSITEGDTSSVEAKSSEIKER